MPYRITRTTPKGTVKRIPTVHPGLGDVARVVGECLHLTGIPQAQAQTYAAELVRLPLGRTHLHESGFRFYIEEIV